MRKVIFALLVFMILCTPSYSQSGTVGELIAQGVAYHQAGKYEQAIETYHKALELYPDNQMILYEMGLSYSAMKDYSMALLISERALELPGKHRGLIYNLKAASLNRLGKTDDAIETYLEAIAEYPLDYNLRFNLAIAQLTAEKVEDAVRSLNSALTLNPRHPTSHLQLGILMGRLGYYKQMRLCYHYYLLLDNGTERAVEVARKLKRFEVTISVGQDGKPDATISLEEQDSEMMFASLLEIAAVLIDKGDLSQSEASLAQLEYLFSGEKIMDCPEENDLIFPSIFHDLYYPFFRELAGQGHTEAYYHYTDITSPESRSAWFEGNRDKFESFAEWLVSVWSR